MFCVLTSDRIPEVIRESWKKTLLEVIKYKTSPSLDQTHLSLWLKASWEILLYPCLMLMLLSAYLLLSNVGWGSGLNVALAWWCGFLCFWRVRVTMPMSSAHSQKVVLLPTAPRLVDIWSMCSNHHSCFFRQSCECSAFCMVHLPRVMWPADCIPNREHSWYCLSKILFKKINALYIELLWQNNGKREIAHFLQIW